MHASGDIRALLHYVPLFEKKCFGLVIDAPRENLAGIFLDLSALQDIDVSLAITSTVHEVDTLLDYASDVEMRYAHTPTPLLSSYRESLARRQAVFLPRGELPDFLHTLQALQASKLLYLLDAQQASALPRGAFLAQKKPPLKPTLLKQAHHACQMGIARVHLLNGNQPSILLEELFSNEGVGTMVHSDSYKLIRPLQEDDIVELLAMIARSVRQSRLIPRHYSAIAQSIEDYYVMEIDGNVVGSVAVHFYKKQAVAELACLYVKESHKGLGYGKDLVLHAESTAWKIQAKSLFALSNASANFFKTTMGYEEINPSSIPASRYAQLLASGRNSRAFIKKIIT